jgi:hypothetical protein
VSSEQGSGVVVATLAESLVSLDLPEAGDLISGLRWALPAIERASLPIPEAWAETEVAHLLAVLSAGFGIGPDSTQAQAARSLELAAAGESGSDSMLDSDLISIGADRFAASCGLQPGAGLQDAVACMERRACERETGARREIEAAREASAEDIRSYEAHRQACRESELVWNGWQAEETKKLRRSGAIADLKSAIWALLVFVGVGIFLNWGFFSTLMPGIEGVFCSFGPALVVGMIILATRVGKNRKGLTLATQAIDAQHAETLGKLWDDAELRSRSEQRRAGEAASIAQIERDSAASFDEISAAFLTWASQTVAHSKVALDPGCLPSAHMSNESVAAQAQIQTLAADIAARVSELKSLRAHEVQVSRRISRLEAVRDDGESMLAQQKLADEVADRLRHEQLGLRNENQSKASVAGRAEQDHLGQARGLEQRGAQEMIAFQEAERLAGDTRRCRDAVEKQKSSVDTLGSKVQGLERSLKDAVNAAADLPRLQGEKQTFETTLARQNSLLEQFRRESQQAEDRVRQIEAQIYAAPEDERPAFQRAQEEARREVDRIREGMRLAEQERDTAQRELDDRLKRIREAETNHTKAQSIESEMRMARAEWERARDGLAADQSAWERAADAWKVADARRAELETQRGVARQALEMQAAQDKSEREGFEYLENAASALAERYAEDSRLAQEETRSIREDTRLQPSELPERQAELSEIRAKITAVDADKTELTDRREVLIRSRIGEIELDWQRLAPGRAVDPAVLRYLAETGTPESIRAFEAAVFELARAADPALVGAATDDSGSLSVRFGHGPCAGTMVHHFGLAAGTLQSLRFGAG